MVDCAGCAHGCRTCCGLLMRPLFHDENCQTVQKPYRSRDDRLLQTIPVNISALALTATSCVDCRLIFQAVDHFSLKRANDADIDDDVTLYLQRGNPLLVQYQLKSIEIMLKPDYSTDGSGVSLIPFIGKGPWLSSTPLTAGSIKTAKNWLRECYETHDQCATTSDLKLPTRLLVLDSDEDEGDLSLIDTNEHDEKAPYAALSHVWGARKPLITVMTSLTSRRRRIEYADLPATFRDAVRICRTFGIGYLWIDSLCIVQDNRDDWQRESSQMASIYGGAYVVLAATAAEDCHRGMLFERDHLPLAYSHDDEGDIELCARMVPTHPQPGVRDPPRLLTRAWVYQERLLGPRILHFNESEITFECSATCSCECGRYPRKAPQSIKHIFSDANVIERFDRSLPAPVEQWFRIVETFSALDITHDRDRLAALSGIAQKFESQAALGKYYAGLWSEHFPYFLLWTHTASWGTYARPQRYVAPSWSWASLRGAVTWSHVRGREWEDDEETPLKIKQVLCIPIGSDRRGQLASGFMFVRGEMSEAKVCESDHHASWTLAIRGGGELYLDLPDGSETELGATVYLLNVSRSHRGQRRKSLVLKHNTNKLGYVRIGLFGHWGWLYEHLIDEWTEREVVIT